MSVVFLGAPGPVFIDPNKQTVINNQTITINGSAGPYTGFGCQEIQLVVNITGAVSGTITFTIKELDPVDQTTVLQSKSGAGITATGTQVIILPATFGDTFSVSWVVSGGTPSFAGTCVTLVGKATGARLGLTSDGTLKPLICDSSGYSVLVGAGTAGSPAGGVITIQGVGGGTSIPISGSVGQGTGAAATAPWSVELTDGSSFYTAAKSTQFPAALVGGRLDVNVGAGTVTANQGTANTAANRWPIYITDGTNTLPTMDAVGRRGYVSITDGTNSMPTMDVVGRAGFQKITDGTNTAAVKAASTAAQATDPSLVVGLSPNSPLPTGANVIGAVTQSAGPWTVTGTKGNNAGAPGTTNLGVLPVLANAAAPTWTEGNQASLSALLNGSLRTDNTSWMGSSAPTVGQKTMANSIPVAIASDQTLSSNRTSSGTLTASGQTVSVATDNCGNCGIQITGTWTGTLVFEATIDGATWFSVAGYLTYSGDGFQPVTSTAINGNWRALVGGFAQFRVRASTAMTGTASVALAGSAGTSITRTSIQQTVEVSTANSTTANLTAGSTFTGTTESALGAAGAQVVAIADQTLEVHFQQSSNGTNWDIDDSFTTTAAVAMSRPYRLTAAYYRVTVKNTGGSPTTYLRVQTELVPVLNPLPRSLGQRTMSESLAVTFASDQTSIPVVVSTPSTGTAGYEFGKVILAGGTANILTRINATTYTEQTTNAQRSLASASASDASAGVGAQQVKITYYDQTCAGPYTETVTLNGVTAVATANSNICFIDKIEVVRVGSTGWNVGVITLYVNNAGGGGTIGTIGVGNIIATQGDNRDFWCHHYVPTGKTAALATLVCGASSASVFFLTSRNPTSALSPETQITEFLNAQSGGSFTRNLTYAVKVTGPARVTGWGIPGTNNVTLNCSFDFSEQ